MTHDFPRRMSTSAIEDLRCCVYTCASQAREIKNGIFIFDSNCTQRKANEDILELGTEMGIQDPLLE